MVNKETSKTEIIESKTEVGTALDYGVVQRKKGLANSIKSLGIVGAIGGVMAAVAGRIGIENNANAVTAGQIAEAHDLTNVFNGGLIATAAGLAIYGVGKLVEYGYQRKAQRMQAAK